MDRFRERRILRVRKSDDSSDDERVERVEPVVPLRVRQGWLKMQRREDRLVALRVRAREADLTAASDK